MLPMRLWMFFRVPGAFELPLASLKAAETGVFDAVIAIGVVIRGETPHFDLCRGPGSRGHYECVTSKWCPDHVRRGHN